MSDPKFTDQPVPLKDIDLKKYKPALKIKSIEAVTKIWCRVRQKYLVVQPEEIIRQLWIEHLTAAEEVSINKIAAEKQFEVLGKQRRFDLLLFDENHDKKVLFEFKAFSEKISNKTFEQISLYNLALKIPFVLISNGHVHYACKIDFASSNYLFIDDLKLILE